MTSKRRICMVGGTGFVGRQLVARLAHEGHYVKVLARHRERRIVLQQWVNHNEADRRSVVCFCQFLANSRPE